MLLEESESTYSALDIHVCEHQKMLETVVEGSRQRAVVLEEKAGDWNPEGWAWTGAWTGNVIMIWVICTPDSDIQRLSTMLPCETY